MKKSVAREYLESIVVAVILAMFARTFVVQAFKIPSGSMEKNLLIGDHILVNKWAYAPSLWGFERTLLPIKKLDHGDVVVFKYPEDPLRDFIKRAIGLPGDRIEVRGREVLRNGSPIEEPYKFHLGGLFGALNSRSFGPERLPAGSVFVLGDNRDNSKDSRWWGYVPIDYFKGQAWLIYWSYESKREDYEASGPLDEARRLLSVGLHFFTRTRWSRTFHMIR
jgi:signal peptidase I